MQPNVEHNPLPGNHQFLASEKFCGIYTHAVEVPANSKQLWLSGQIGVAQNGAIASNFRGQFKQAMENISANLDAAQMTLQDIVQMRFYLVSRDDLDDLVTLQKSLLNGLAPAVSTYFVAGLVDESLKIEIEVLACKQANKERTEEIVVPYISKYAQML